MRLSDWQTRLHAYLVEHGETPFQYGALDCGLFVADVVERLTGIDPAQPLRGRYRTRKEAFAAIKALCGKPTMEAVASYLARECGMREIPVAFAQRADAVQIGAGRLSRLGIVAPHGTELLCPGKDGLLRMDRNKAVRAWRIE